MDHDFEKRLFRQQNGSPVLSASLSPFANRRFSYSSPLSPACQSPVKSERYGDRFIPCRAGARLHLDFSLISENEKGNNSSSKHNNHQNQQQTHSSIRLPPQHIQSQQSTDRGRKRRKSVEISKDNLRIYQCLLKNELLGANIENLKDVENPGSICSEKKNLFKYSLRMKRADTYDCISPYSLSPVSCKSQKLLQSPRKPPRNIPKVPFRVLDAPELQDDFYLNLIDWSANNILSVGLGSSVYLWSAFTSQVTRLCDFSTSDDTITSVNCSEKGDWVAVGTRKGIVQVYDTSASQVVIQLNGHSSRVCALAWNGEQLSSGSRDRMIFQRDIRSHHIDGYSDRKLAGHKQEVCGLKWSPDKQHLASGGNDNKLLIWNASASSSYQEKPAQVYSEHTAAVKAIAWSPHHHGLLASGGGTADRYIRFWNTLTQQSLQFVNSGSQVCNLAWSKHASELVSTHGYSQNQIMIWDYPSLDQVAKLTGHSYRVLYLATSPDGEAIVTGAGDETLRFWNVFSKSSSNKKSTSVLNIFNRIR